MTDFLKTVGLITLFIFIIALIVVVLVGGLARNLVWIKWLFS